MLSNSTQLKATSSSKMQLREKLGQHSFDSLVKSGNQKFFNLNVIEQLKQTFNNADFLFIQKTVTNSIIQIESLSIPQE